MKFDINNIDEIINDYTKEEKQEIKSIIAKYKGTENEIDKEGIKELVQNVTIYSDFDDVLVDLMKAWVKDINKKTNTDYKYKDVNNFRWFQGIEGGMDFLENEDLYQKKDEKGEQIIKLRNDVIPFLKELKRNDMLDNLLIVTATYYKNYVSKKEFISEHLSEYIDEKSVVTTNSKFSLDFNNAVLIDDGAHNVEDTVMTNPYAYTFVISHPHNQKLYTGKRIKRILTLKEVLYYLPLTVLRSYDRRMDPEKAYLRREGMLNKKRRREVRKKNEEVKQLSKEKKVVLNYDENQIEM